MYNWKKWTLDYKCMFNSYSWQPMSLMQNYPRKMLTFAPNPALPVKEEMHHFICVSDCLSPTVHKKQKCLYVSGTSCKLRTLFTRMSKTLSKNWTSHWNAFDSGVSQTICINPALNFKPAIGRKANKTCTNEGIVPKAWSYIWS